MTQEEFMRLNPYICTTYGIMRYTTREALLIQGIFFTNHKFIFDTLDPNEVEFIKLRYGVENQTPMEYKLIAKQLDMPVMKVKEIELKTLRKLRHPSRIKLLKEYNDDTIDKSLLEKFNKPKSL